MAAPAAVTPAKQRRRRAGSASRRRSTSAMPQSSSRIGDRRRRSPVAAGSERGHRRDRRRPRRPTATMLLNGSGEALIPSRRLALTPWLASAIAPRAARRPAPDRGRERRRRQANSSPIQAADRGPDDGLAQVPDAVEQRHLVGDELDRVHDPGARPATGVSVSCVGNRLGADAPASPAQAEHEHRGPGVDARGPAAGDQGRDELHARGHPKRISSAARRSSPRPGRRRRTSSRGRPRDRRSPSRSAAWS